MKTILTAKLYICLLSLSIVHIQIHTHLKWGGYEKKIIIH
jgi:hypothetical protein